MPFTKGARWPARIAELTAELQELRERVERLEADAAPVATRRTTKKAAPAASE